MSGLQQPLRRLWLHALRPCSKEPVLQPILQHRLRLPTAWSGLRSFSSNQDETVKPSREPLPHFFERLKQAPWDPRTLDPDVKHLPSIDLEIDERSAQTAKQVQEANAPPEIRTGGKRSKTRSGIEAVEVREEVTRLDLGMLPENRKRYKFENEDLQSLHQMLPRLLDMANADTAELHQARIAEIVKCFQRHKLDTGSTEVQVAILSYRIGYLRAHMGVHRKDHHSKRGLVGLISQRRKLLRYFARKDYLRYAELCAALDIPKEQHRVRTRKTPTTRANEFEPVPIKQ